MKLSKSIYSVLVGIVCSMASNAQSVESMVAKYPGKTACHTLLKTHYEIGIVNGEIAVTEQVSEEIMYLSEKNPTVVQDKVSFSSFFELNSIEAFTMVPQTNGKYKKVKVKDFVDASNTAGWVFYDDSRERSFHFKNITKGAKTRLNYSYKINQPNLLTPFFMQSYLPADKLEFSVAYTDDVEIGYKLMNLNEGEYTFTQTKKGNRNILTWSRNQVKDFKYESDGPNPKYYLPQIHVFLVSSKTRTGVQTHVGSIDNLHKWYRELIKDYNRNDKPSKELMNIVDSLTNGLTEELDKVRVIYKWVQGNIQYVAFENELAGFVPRAANVVCTRRFGDCKDMASIITEMLDFAGVKSYLTWIGTTSIPYSYSDIATPVVDNHMIATYIDKNGKPYFLDATDKYIDFEHPASHIQGKEALVSLSETEYKVFVVPRPEKEYTVYTDSVWMGIEGNKLVGKAMQYQTGYYRNFFTYRLTGRKADEQKEMLKGALEKGSNKFRLHDFEVKNLDVVEQPLTIQYTFDIGDYVHAYQDELYIDMNLSKRIGSKIEDDREVPFEYEFKSSESYVYTLTIPDGYEVKYLPENLTLSIPNFEIKLEYKQEGNKIVYNMTQNSELVMFEKEDFESWNQLFASANKFFSETIVLKKK
ncbi:MAG: DUF3857 domain-containing protein [Flavobacteriales bacterium]|nr:DUF3857 domain-containing protein [Flavobacteriales bacterium]